VNPIINIQKKVRETISRYGMIDSGDLLIVAVSGGPDSVCLLDILNEFMDELGIDLVVAHYDHGLRPAEDETETKFVRSLAKSMSLPFETEKTSFLGKNDVSPEEAARTARYTFLEKVRKKHDAQKIALGHNLNDQAETILMRLLRGSGLSGLSGIPPCRNTTIIRPLIEVERQEIEDYLKARKLSSVTDSSNLEQKYLRNRIRLELMPMLKSYQPRLIAHLGHVAEVLRDENDYLERVTENWLDEEAETVTEADISIPIASFLDLPAPLRKRATRQLIKKIRKNLRRISRDHIESIYQLAQADRPQGLLDLPDGLTIKKTYDRLTFTAADPKRPGHFHYLLEGPGTFHLEKIGKTISLVEIEKPKDLNLAHSQWTAYVDADKLRYPILVRNFRPGDRFIPLGMKGHKKVKDFFVDLKIPTELRRLTPILLSEDTPVWISGFRIDDRFKVTPKTKRILKITLN
jgi:tRNA(Ile)-lysidine synthase